DGIRDKLVTGVQTCALPICRLRQLLEPSIDECREQRPRALAVGLLPFRERGAQPHAVDHGGDHRGKAARLLARYQTAQIAAQVRSEERRVGKGGRVWGAAWC